MQTAELPTKIYEPKPSDPERISALAQSDAPVKVYIPQGGAAPLHHPAKGI